MNFVTISNDNGVCDIISSVDDHQKKLKKLKSATNAAGLSHFNLERYQETKVQLIPDPSISLGKFKASILVEGAYMAHPTTIRAMKKDIFAAGNELFEDLEDIIECSSCRQQIDRQFWYFCPYCEAQFPKSDF